jgi:hypothetical protein
LYPRTAAPEKRSTIRYLFSPDTEFGSNRSIWLSLISKNPPWFWSIQRRFVVRTPTVLPGPDPLAVYATIVGNPFKPKVRFLSVIGSYGWSGNTVQTVAGMMPNLKVEVLNPVRFS